VLASRAAEHMFWAARYLERAEDTARIVAQHTDLLVDLPTSTPLRWDPLLAINSLPTHDVSIAEHEIVTQLVSARDNPSSIACCVASARENLRTTREIIPRDAWQAVNDLFLFVNSRHDEGVRRATRSRFMRHVIAEEQRIVGILSGTMSRDSAYAVMRLGRNLERADMTTRVLDVRAGSLLAEESTFESIQWASVLKSLSAFQMYRRSSRQEMSGDDVVRFCLTDPDFPRSVTHCLAEVAASLVTLPRSDPPYRAYRQAIQALASLPLEHLDGAALHQLCDDVQAAIAAISEACTTTYFRPQPAEQWQSSR
jgi:uncharacterized alpha-E superfamily protein